MLNSSTLPKKESFFRKNIYPYWKHRYLILLFLPALLYYVIFRYGPLYGIQIAFKQFSLVKGITGSPWLDPVFKNFIRLFSLNKFQNVFANTLIISFAKLIFGFPAPIIFTILLNEIVFPKFKKTVQTISYLPHFLSWILLISVFNQLLSPSTGPVNLFLKMLGQKEIYFMADPKVFRSMVVVTSIWKSIGWNSIVYLAAITGISPELYEAAIIDGATRFQKIWYITLPELAPVVSIMFIFAVGGIINDDFEQIYNMLNPAVSNVGNVISTYVYNVGLIEMKYGFSTAVGLFKNVIAFALVFLANWFSKKVSDYGIW